MPIMDHREAHMVSSSGGGDGSRHPSFNTRPSDTTPRCATCRPQDVRRSHPHHARLDSPLGRHRQSGGSGGRQKKKPNAILNPSAIEGSASLVGEAFRRMLRSGSVAEGHSWGNTCTFPRRSRERTPRTCRTRLRVFRDEWNRFGRASKRRMVASAKRKDVGAEPCAHEVRKASETTEVSGDAEGRSGGNADEQDDNKPAVFRSCTEDMLRSLLEESPMAIQALQAQGKLAVGRQADERPILANVGRRRTREREGDARADDRSKMQRTSLASGGCGARFGFPCWSPVTPEPDKHKNNQGSALSMGPADLVPRCGQFKSDLPVLGYAIPTWENRKPSALAGKTSPENTPLTMAVDYLKNVLDKSSPEGAAQERDPGEDDGDALVREQHWDATTDREFPESFHNTACKCVQVPCTPFPSHQEDYYEVEGYPDPYNEYSQPKQNLSTLDGRNMTSANTREDEADDWLRQPQSLPCGGDSECTPLIRQGTSLRYECVDRHANAGHAYHAVDQACPYQLSQGRAGMSKSSTHNGLSLDERARSFYPRSSSSRDMEGRSGLMQLIQMAARLEAQLQSSAVKLRTAQDLHMEQYSEIEKLKAACTLLHEENLRLRDALACISQGEGRKNMRAKESSIFSGGPIKAPKNAHGNKSRQNVQMSVPREEGRTESKDPSCSLKSVTREQGTQAHSHPVGRSRVANPADPIPVHKHQEDVCRTPSDAAGESNPPVSRAATMAN